MIQHVLLHALEDSAKMLPFLFAAYLLIEFIERRQGERIERALAGGGRWGFAVGALLGCAPQCGFPPWPPISTAAGSSAWAR